MTGRVFLDSGIFIAFLNRRDTWHESAVALFGAPLPRLCTSMLVVAETYSWFLHRMGEEEARRFRLMVHSLSGLERFDIAAEHDRAVGEVLERWRGTKLTYVDASSLALINHHRIRKVWGTDYHLGFTGAEVLPRP